MLHRPLARALGALLLVTLGAAEAQAQSGTVRGTVRDSAGAPVAGVILTVDRTQVRTQTAASGAYTLVGVPAGSQTVRARVIGFAPQAATVDVRAGQATTLDLTLGRAAQQLQSAVVTGSRAQHTAADELAVPVDIVTSETIERQGTTELSAILQAVSPSVNFPRQSVTDADDIVRPFTMRGLSPDHTVVLVNGVRRHRTALVHTFAFGMPAGSTGVDLNALPASMIERMEVLRDGAAAQYGADAIAGVVNLQTRSGEFAPFVTADFGRYVVGDYPDDGNTVNVNGGWGLTLGRGQLGVFAEYRNRQPTNRAWPEAADQIVPGDADVVDSKGRILQKNNPVGQPNHRLGDGLADDKLLFVDYRRPLDEAGRRVAYAFGSFADRVGTGNGFYRQGLSERNWPSIYPLGFLPEFRPDVLDWSLAGGVKGEVGDWAFDAALAAGRNEFDYQLRNTLNTSLGPCLQTACAPGLDGILGNGDDPGIPNQTSFYAGGLRSMETQVTFDANRQYEVGLPSPLTLAVGATLRQEQFELIAGERASWIQGGHVTQYGDPAPAGSQVFSGFLPSTATDVSRTNTAVYAEAETDLSRTLLVNGAARFENYSDFGSQLSTKLALRWQPAKQFVVRGAFSTGFRAPSLAQSHYGSRITSFKLDTLTGNQVPFEVGIFSVGDPAARALGAKALKAETSTNLSAGFAWSPSERTTLTVDGYSITLKDRILLTGFLGGPAIEAILNANGVQAEAGQYFTNIVDTRTNGIDITGSHRVLVGASGVLVLSTGINYTTNEVVGQRPDPVELNGTGAVLVDQFTRIQIERERPDWRGTLTADYTRGRNSALVRASYFGSFHSAPGLCDTCEQVFGARTLLDLEVGRQFGGVRWTLGARNLLDTYPEQNTLDNGYGIFPWAGASPFGYNGRFLYTRAQMQFDLP
ncbi:MAG: TonB-dependent receptor [Gemmatimonadaceae bacterium]|nr:TonB-dependent receptor [Gemmatimonadaceae bacterium]